MNKPYDWYPVPVTVEFKRDKRDLSIKDFFKLVRLLRWFRQEQLIERLRKVGGL